MRRFTPETRERFLSDYQHLPLEILEHIMRTSRMQAINYYGDPITVYGYEDPPVHDKDRKLIATEVVLIVPKTVYQLYSEQGYEFPRYMRIYPDQNGKYCHYR